MRNLKPMFFLLTVLTVSLLSCKNDEEPTGDDNTNTTEIPAVYQKIYGATDMYVDGDYIVIESTGLPDHTSVYYEGTQWEDSLYEAYNGSNPDFAVAPNVIASFDYTFTIPLNPEEAAVKDATPGGPIGVSLNGVPFFNQYNGAGDPLTAEINSFDQWNGHPTPSSMYHYHVEPTYLTQYAGTDQLLGFLLDGFPVYGPEENGATLTDSDLDVYHGHFGVTTDYPDGIYHYHITSEAPYINGDGFFGTPGTVTN